MEDVRDRAISTRDLLALVLVIALLLAALETSSECVVKEAVELGEGVVEESRHWYSMES